MLYKFLINKNFTNVNPFFCLLGRKKLLTILYYYDILNTICIFFIVPNSLKMRKLKKIKKVKQDGRTDKERIYRISQLKRVAARKSSLLKALEASHGLVATACREIGLSTVTHYDYYKKDKLYKQKVDEINEREIDFSEQKLRENIDRGKQASIFFHLKCRGKHRGYFEKSQFDLSGSVGVQTVMIGGQEIEF